jgi:hypothetical protein
MSSLLKSLPRAEQAPLVDGHDRSRSEPDRSIVQAIDQDREGFDVARRDGSVGEIISLPPPEGSTDNLPALLAPGCYQRLQCRGLAGAGRRDSKGKPSSRSEPLDCSPLCDTMCTRAGISTLRSALADFASRMNSCSWLSCSAVVVLV